MIQESGLTSCGLESRASCGLTRYGRTIPWETKKSDTVTSNGSKYLLFEIISPNEFIVSYYILDQSPVTSEYELMLHSPESTGYRYVLERTVLPGVIPILLRFCAACCQLLSRL